MKRGLVLEGGAMRGLFTAGVIDVFMENDIIFDGAVGVSAGAAFGCNYKSNQPRRVVRYNTRFCRDKRYCSVRSLIKTGDMFGAEFCYHEIPDKLDLFDFETYRKSPMEFYIVATDVESGEPVYHKCDEGGPDDVLWMGASAAIPLASRIVEIDSYKLLDGGIADSIALKFFQNIGYKYNVVVLTQPLGYVKNKNKFLPIIKKVYKKYPNFVARVSDRHIRYNETIKYIKNSEKIGETLIIAPPYDLNIGAVERNPDELERVYQIGRTVAKDLLSDVLKFIHEHKSI